MALLRKVAMVAIRSAQTYPGLAIPNTLTLLDGYTPVSEDLWSTTVMISAHLYLKKGEANHV